MQKHLRDYIDNSTDFEVRGLRLLLEYFYSHSLFREHLEDNSAPKVISVFGSARTKPGTQLYRKAYKLGHLLYESGYAIVTGASQGVMQAANEGVCAAIAQKIYKEGDFKSISDVVKHSKQYAKEKRLYSLGLKITLPFEPIPNQHVGRFATFHYFNIRKFFFAGLSRGFVACDGGWGTRDELYEMLTLVQTGKAPLMPIVIVSDDYRALKGDIDSMAKKGCISKNDLLLIEYVKTAEEAAARINKFYRRVDKIVYPRGGETVKIYLRQPISQETLEKMEELVHANTTPYEKYTYGKKVIKLTGTPHKSFGPLRMVVEIINND